MTPVQFSQANTVFTKPEGWATEKCGNLHAWRGQVDGIGPAIVSAWMPSNEDLKALNEGKPLFLSICGSVMPPVSLFTENPFPPTSETANP